jgi:dTDP-glucose 4,6-dehydratase
VGHDLPMTAHFAVGNFIGDALLGRDIILNGDGTAVRSYLDQRDLVVWLLNILENGKPGEAYNVGSDQEISILDLAYMVKDLLAPNVNVIIRGAKFQSTDRNRYIPDIAKAKYELNLKVEITLDRAIKDAVLNLECKAR